MNKVIACTIVASTIFIACGQQPKQPVQAQITSSDTTLYFQVAQFIKGEIAEVNRTPFFIYKISGVNNQRDSTPINTAQFTVLAQSFLSPDISQPPLKNQYSESVFFDETTNNYAISYTTSNKELEVQNVEVLLNEDGETVKRVFIRKFYNYADSSAIEQLSWKTGENFQINRLVQGSSNKEKSYRTQVVWGAAENNR